MNKSVTGLLKKNYVFIAILVFAAIVRFYDFADRITFGPEQAISLLVSGDYINEKFSLLGLPSTQRTTSLGHIIYYPPVFNYSLIPLLIVFNYSPVYITGFFAILNLATGLLLYFAAKKIFNKEIALFSTALFLFNDYMINHSLFIWSVNYLPILNIGVLYLLVKIWQKKPLKHGDFLPGFLVSLSLGLEYIYLFTAIPVFLLALYLSQNKLKSMLYFLAGAVLGNLPTIIFDLTHGFYHTKTLWQYLLDLLSTPGKSHITYYHFLQFWPLLALTGGIILYKVYKLSRTGAVVLTLSIVAVNLISPRVSFFGPAGMYPGLNFPKLEKAAQIIAGDNPHDFNLVMTFDFDSRAHPMRYLLKYTHGYKSNGVEDYPNSKNLYVLSEQGYPVMTTGLWEISSFNASDVKVLGEIDGFPLYKLTKSD